ncbi:MAG: glycosyltransferase family 1 protein [Ignavibacteria bacterium]
MRIAFDCRVLERQMTGIGRYLLNILNEIPGYDKKSQYFLISNLKLAHIKNDFYTYINLNKKFINGKIFTPIWLNYFLPPVIRQNKIDVLIGPNILIPTTKKLKDVIRISIVHDIMPLTHPQFFPFFYKNYLKIYLPSSIKSSDLIITISEASKREILNYFDLEENRIKIVYNTFSEKFRKLSEDELLSLIPKSRLKLPEKFLLYVGVLEKRKNIGLFIKLADKINENKLDFKIVLVGRPGFGFNEFKEALEKRSNIISIIQGADDSDLLLLYNKAFALIFPSYVEGFGLPPIEAMACGTPVIASNCDALKEILNDAALLHDPDDVDGIFNSILKLNSDQRFYNAISEKSIEHSKLYSRENTMNSFMNIINSIKA